MNNRLTLKSIPSIVFLAAAVLLMAGCDLVPLHMRVQPRYEPLDPSAMWADGMSARPIPANTIPRGHWGEIKIDPIYYTGKITETGYVQQMPITVNRATLQRGQERFNIFCSPCHGRVGDGQGMIVQRGLKKPPSFHDPRLVDSPDGYFFDVMANGFGVMYGYASRINPDDRWAIVAYIRALQYSQNVHLDSLPADVRQQIESQLQ
ncbi:MAG: hypothetical protein FOGNACKC_02028 [Anaerolineae bacterium]|nr:hypothetical protein [Anaerolineae bacterium]